MMMQQLTPSLPPVPASGDLKLLAGLVELMLELIRDPKKGKALIDQLSAGATEYQQAHERVLQGQRDLNARALDFDRMSERRQKELDFTIERDRKAFDADVAARTAVLEADQKELTRLKQQAEKDAAAAGELRRTWENKMAALNKLAAA
jgi:hypothetical protein